MAPLGQGPHRSILLPTKTSRLESQLFGRSALTDRIGSHWQVDVTHLVDACSAGVALVHLIVLVARSPFLEFGSQCILIIRGFQYTRTGVTGELRWSHSCGFVLYAFARALMWALFCSRLGFTRLGGFWCTMFRGFLSSCAVGEQPWGSVHPMSLCSASSKVTFFCFSKVS